MNDSKASQSGNPAFSRRKLLAAFGVAGLSAASASAMTGPESPNKGPALTEFRFYGSRLEMQQDKTLKGGCIAKTSGFYKPGDGGSAEYLVIRNTGDTAEGNGIKGEHIPLEKGLLATLINVASVNYQLFGARGQKDNDDGIAIKAAHEYANRMGLPLINLNGEYWISKTNAIPIATDVNWGKTIFHIDEKYNARVPRFKIISRYQPINIELSASDKAAVLAKLKPGVSIITELIPYKNMLLHITDSNDRVGFRAGRAYDGKVSRPREEFFYVEEHGRIIGDIAWAFKAYTSFVGYPADESYLTVEGGTFYLSGDYPLPKLPGYLANGFQISRSRTIIRNQWVGLEKGSLDSSMNSRTGFYNFSKVFDALLENIRLLPWEKDRPDKDKVVDQGTYGISGAYMLNVVFRNITAEGSAQHWGVFGTNLNKNFRIEYCNLNRVDVHFHCWNLYISHSEIGFRGLTVTGGGDLFIENTKVHSNNFISFRKDYGGKWSGNINIRNCRLIPPLARTTALLAFPSEDFGYGYPIGYAHKIKVEDFIVDYANIPTSRAIGWLVFGSATSSTAASGRLFFPYLAEFRNILVEGRDMGLRLLEMPDFKVFQMPRQSIYDGVEIVSNSRLVFDTVQLEKIDASSTLSAAHILLSGSDQKQDPYTLIPLIQFKECHNLVGSFAGNIAELQFENCSIARLSAADKSKFPGSIRFTNCKFKPVLLESKAPYALSATLGTSFTNCIIHMPQMNQESRADLLPMLDFMLINKRLRYNHLNTRLGIDLLNYCKSKGIVLNPKFISMLQSHHELESENI
jgi:hypothetical protein